MAKSKIIKTGKKIADSVVGGYEKIEKGVVDDAIHATRDYIRLRRLHTNPSDWIKKDQKYCGSAVRQIGIY